MRYDLTLVRLLVGAAMASLLLLTTVGCSDDVDTGNGDDAAINVEQDDTGVADVGGEDTDVGLPDTEPGDTDPAEDSGEPEDTAVSPGPDDTGDANGEPDPELPALAVHALRPERGPIDGGTPFVIEGQGFTEHTTVLFGANSVETDVVDDAITGTTPAGEALGPVTVRVMDEETGDDAIADGFTYIEPLELDSVQPGQIPVHGGTEVTLTGRGFSPDTRVVVGDRPAAEHLFVGSDTMRFVAPPNPVGPADVRVVDEDSSALKTDGVTYFSSVELHSVDPAYGPVDGGTDVTVVGEKFDPNLQVFFDEVQAAVSDVASDGTEATVELPAGSAGLVDVRVETSDDGARLDNGFAYVDETATGTDLEAIVPDRGTTTGGDRVYLTGAFGEMDPPTVTFGGTAAAVVDAVDHIITVDTPAAAQAESVDVTVDDGQQTLTADDGFTYFTPLAITDVSPSQGPLDGGTEVTVEGSGFEAVTQLRLAGVSLPFDVVDDDTIKFTTPAAGAGPADLYLSTDDGRSILEFEAFIFVGDLEIWNFSPIRGSVAGNTYVELQGTGFTDSTEVYFGTEPAATTEYIDPHTLAVRTPPKPSGAVDVVAENAAGEATAPDQYTFFNPGAQTGGAWGNPIDGAVNVTVFSIMGAPVEDAFVMLSTNANTPYTGHTDAAGLVTLSGPDILGEQTVTATAPGHSSTTVQYVDAENITIFLRPDADGDPEFPPPPPTATFTGDITGLDKLHHPGPDEILMAVVETTRPSIYDEVPDPGGQNIVTEDGQYSITTRIGELALVVTAGLYNVITEEFQPARMGVARYLTAADGGVYEVDIDLDIPLDSSVELKFDGAPLGDPDGPDTNRATLFLDLSVDGVYGPMGEYTSESEMVEMTEMAPLVGDLDDGTYRVLAQSDVNGGLPFSQAFVRSIDEVNTTISTPPMVSTIDFTTPQSMGVPNNGLVQWNTHGVHQPDFYYVYLEEGPQEIIWEIFLPGDTTSFQFPDFPPFDPSDYDEEEGVPMPYPGGFFTMVAIGFRKDGLSADNFSYDDLDITSADGISAAAMLIGF